MRSTMRIEEGAVVRLAYELRNVAGDALEDENAEMEYLHGYGNIFPKVEDALEGKERGYELAITLEPEDAFDEYDADLVRVEPRARFPETLEVGDISIRDPEVVVTDLKLNEADIVLGVDFLSSRPRLSS